MGSAANLDLQAQGKREVVVYEQVNAAGTDPGVAQDGSGVLVLEIYPGAFGRHIVVVHLHIKGAHDGGVNGHPAHGVNLARARKGHGAGGIQRVGHFVEQASKAREGEARAARRHLPHHGGLPHHAGPGGFGHQVQGEHRGAGGGVLKGQVQLDIRQVEQAPEPTAHLLGEHKEVHGGNGLFVGLGPGAPGIAQERIVHQQVNGKHLGIAQGHPGVEFGGLEYQVGRDLVHRSVGVLVGLLGEVFGGLHAVVGRNGHRAGQPRNLLGFIGDGERQIRGIHHAIHQGSAQEHALMHDQGHIEVEFAGFLPHQGCGRGPEGARPQVHGVQRDLQPKGVGLGIHGHPGGRRGTRKVCRHPKNRGQGMGAAEGSGHRPGFTRGQVHHGQGPEPGVAGRVAQGHPQGVHRKGKAVVDPKPVDIPLQVHRLNAFCGPVEVQGPMKGGHIVGAGGIGKPRHQILSPHLYGFLHQVLKGQQRRRHAEVHRLGGHDGIPGQKVPVGGAMHIKGDGGIHGIHADGVGVQVTQEVHQVVHPAHIGDVHLRLQPGVPVFGAGGKQKHEQGPGPGTKTAKFHACFLDSGGPKAVK